MSELRGDEFVEAYDSGRRDFPWLGLNGISLPNAILREASFPLSSLVGADLTGADLSRCAFNETDLTVADFSAASLLHAEFIEARLTGANFCEANLTGASLYYVKCDAADMRRAYLGNAFFEDSILDGTNFEGAVVGGTHFVNLDVGPLCEASFVMHEAPSTLDTRTMMKSYRHPRLKSFMIDCGVPEVFAEYMIECARALGDDVLHELMQSTFISYGAPDEPFARRLYDALRAHGVVTFFFPETARVGERIGDEVFRALQRHDRMVLVCSQASLDRPGVLNEVQETFDREVRDGGATYLIPVMLDDYLLDGWKPTRPDIAHRVRSRVGADFRGAENDSAKFDAALSRLLAALRKKNPAR